MNSQDQPNFLIIGAAKAGTSSLHHYLVQHPQVYMPRVKEIQFFTDDQLYRKGIDYYLHHFFKDSNAFPARGEATPLYMHRPCTVIPRITQSFGKQNLKFIVILRDPVKRAWSHYLHSVRLGTEPLEFEAAVQAEGERVKKNQIGWRSYFSDGLYAAQLSEWFDAFPKECFYICTQEELADNPQALLNKIFCFLNISPDVVIDCWAPKNKASEAKSIALMKILMGQFPGAALLKLILPLRLRRQLGMKLRLKNLSPLKNPPKIDKAVAQSLRHLYDPDLAKLETMLDRDFSRWRAS